MGFLEKLGIGRGPETSETPQESPETKLRRIRAEEMAALKAQYRERTGKDIDPADEKAMDMLREQAERKAQGRLASEQREVDAERVAALQNDEIARIKREKAAGIVSPERAIAFDAGEGVPEDEPEDTRSADEIASAFLRERGEGGKSSK